MLARRVLSCEVSRILFKIERMKTFLKLSLVVLLFATISLHADAADKNFGVGAIFGEPTGLTIKYFTKEKFALDSGLAYSFFQSFVFYGDGLWHFPGIFRGSVPELGPLTPYLGIGAGLRVISKSKPSDGDPNRPAIRPRRSGSLGRPPFAH